MWWSWWWLLYVALGLANLFWLICAVQGAIALRRSLYLPETNEPVSTPKVSILVPARNESRNLARSLESLVHQDYPNIEILVIDDHSEDDTHAIAESFAKRDSRVRVLSSADLPPDWRGKSWALHQAAAHATGNWMLFTDADVVHHPSVLRNCIATAQKERIDLLSILPHVECVTFWERVVLPAFAIILSMIFPVHRSNDPKSPVALAAGGYILLKSLLFRHMDGYHRIRDAVAEDVKLAEMFKSSGYRIRTFMIREARISTRMYDSLQEIWEGLSRHAYEAVGYKAGRLMASVLAGFGLMILPVLAFVAGLVLPDGMLILASAFPMLAMIAAQTAANRQFRVPYVYFFSFPVAAALYGLILLNSMISHDLRGGNVWKGRRYKKEGKVA